MSNKYNYKENIIFFYQYMFFRILYNHINFKYDIFYFLISTNEH